MQIINTVIISLPYGVLWLAISCARAWILLSSRDRGPEQKQYRCNLPVEPSFGLDTGGLGSRPGLGDDGRSAGRLFDGLYADASRCNAAIAGSMLTMRQARGFRIEILCPLRNTPADTSLAAI